MNRLTCFLATTAILCGTTLASAASVTFDFEDGTDQGFGTGFGNDASKSFPIVSIGGSMRMETTLGGFQIAGRETSNPAENAFQALLAASADEAGYVLSYDWYIDTSLSPGGFGNFLQLGTFMNAGSGYYAQNFPGTGKELELNGTQLASGQVFSGTVAQTFAAKGFNIPLGETFFRPGLIMNGDGTAVKMYFDNISIYPLIPEPASLTLFGLSGVALLGRRR
jgi:hypothetical protein